jgi:hypothetical protein
MATTKVSSDQASLALTTSSDKDDVQTLLRSPTDTLAPMRRHGCGTQPPALGAAS